MEEDLIEIEEQQEEEGEIIVDDVMEENPEPQDDDKDDELAVEDDANDKDNKEAASHPEPSPRHKELYGRYSCGHRGAHVPGALKLEVSTTYFLDRTFSVGCGTFRHEKLQTLFLG